MRQEIFIKSIIYFAAILCFFAAIIPSYAASILSVTATVVSRNDCRFNTGTSSLNFGTLDPGNPSDKTVNTSVTFRCGGSAPMAIFSITHDSGLYETATDAPRMRNATVTTEYLPYTLSLSPTSGTVRRNTNRTLTISGTVQGTYFQNAYAGNYRDRVVISIEP
jgi:spore coat protein U-like protein